MEAILRLSGRWEPLSAFSRAGVLIPTLEHHFHAAKARNREDAMYVLEAPTPREAKRRGREIKMRKDWEEVKLQVMFGLNVVKFSSGAAMKVLLATDGAYIEHGNRHSDRFWGTVDGVGSNWLGRILMGVRDGQLWLGVGPPGRVE